MCPDEESRPLKCTRLNLYPTSLHSQQITARNQKHSSCNLPLANPVPLFQLCPEMHKSPAREENYRTASQWLVNTTRTGQTLASPETQQWGKRFLSKLTSVEHSEEDIYIQKQKKVKSSSGNMRNDSINVKFTFSSAIRSMFALGSGAAETLLISYCL